jgi:hypothetical protein
MSRQQGDQDSHVAYTEPIRSTYSMRYAVGCETCGWKDDETYAHIEDARSAGRAHEALEAERS